MQPYWWCQWWWWRCRWYQSLSCLPPNQRPFPSCACACVARACCGQQTYDRTANMDTPSGAVYRWSVNRSSRIRCYDVERHSVTGNPGAAHRTSHPIPRWTIRHQHQHPVTMIGAGADAVAAAGEPLTHGTWHTTVDPADHR
uniref:Putative secreted protein n=1 Tax=Anopheles marajoara TaxID=58244 RepID=A0A2M4C7K9_9DIPT